MTELGSSTPQAETSVEADNWMAALKGGRAELGEAGGLPTGSSCAVAPDGKVTIHDPIERRTYILTPDVSTSFASSRPPPPADGGGPRARASGPPRIPAEEVPRRIEATSEAPTVVRPRSEAPPAVEPQKKPSYVPPPPEAAPPAKQPKRAARTMAYNIESPLAGREVVVGPKAAGPAPSFAAVEPAAPQMAPDMPTQEMPIADLPTVETAAVPDEPAPAPAARAPSTPPPAPAAVTPEPAPRPPSTPPPAPPPEPVPAPSAPAPRSDGADVLTSRDQDPSKDNPLLYRERVYVVAEGTSEEDAEEVIRTRFASLRDELGGRPKGKFFNLAVFDHRWEGRPRRLPVVTLQWKDWRGEPQVDYPLRRRTEASPRTPAPAAAPPVAVAPAPPASGPAPASTPAPAAAVSPFAASSGSRPRVSAPPAPAPAAAVGPADASLGSAVFHRRTSTDEHDARLAQAFEACQDLLFLSTPAESLDFVIKLLDELLPSEAASACLYDINTDEFRFVALSGAGGEQRKAEALPGNVGLFAAAANRGEDPLIVEDVTRDGRYDPGADGRVGLEARSLLYFPLLYQGRLLGMLQLINAKSGGKFSPGDANLVAYVGRQLSKFLNEARIRPDRKTAG